MLEKAFPSTPTKTIRLAYTSLAQDRGKSATPAVTREEYIEP
jgi:hypothetical protein